MNSKKTVKKGNKIKIINYGYLPIMFGSKKCPACLMQFKLMDDLFNKLGKKGSVKYYDLDNKKPPIEIIDKDGNYSMPTWYIPKTDGKGMLKKGIITNENILQKIVELDSDHLPTKNVSFGGLRKNNTQFGFGSIPRKNRKLVRKTVVKATGVRIRRPRMGIIRRRNQTRFGASTDYTPTIDGRASASIFNKSSTKSWADINGSTPGTFERSGEDYYSKNYFYGPRMGGNPSNDYSTALFLNRNCNNMNTRDYSKKPGLLYDSPNQMISSSGFGGLRRRPVVRPRSKSRFGLSLIRPAKAYDNSISITPYGGGTNKKENIPSLGNGYIASAKPYNPIGNGNKTQLFGKRKKSKRSHFGSNCKGLKFNDVKEGSVIELSSNGKIKVKN